MFPFLLLLLLHLPLTLPLTPCPFLIYIYTPTELPLPPHLFSQYAAWDPRSIYSIEQRIYHSLKEWNCTTSDKDDADFFYVPIFPSSIAHMTQYTSSSSHASLSSSYTSLSSFHTHLLHHSPHYVKNNGTDHIFTIGHDVGACLCPRWMGESVFLQVMGSGDDVVIGRRGNVLRKYLEISLEEGEGEEGIIGRSGGGGCFPRRGVVVPPFIGERYSLSLDEHFNRKEGGKDIKYYFRGSVLQMPYSFGVRQWLSREGLARDFIVNTETLTNDDLYWKELTSSVFCFSPPGWFEWSPRTFQAIAAGCIPVVIKSAGTRMPFERFLDWNEFSVFIDLDDFEREITEFIASVDRGEWNERIIAMQQKLKEVWRAFTYGSNPADKTQPRVFVVEGKSGEFIEAVAESDVGGAVDYIIEELTLLMK
ncbi:hypothetical protein TrST_g8854 [Triparma strigata]|uniref:Exostosin GT47 domain-containing protein n=1 Tax=Triparma strigata TaxID=1606541 RepID=A0A9W7C2C0_9STRA|nr:hypothetical protein TrST_g8854 [Triparma strigata]